VNDPTTPRNEIMENTIKLYMDVVAGVITTKEWIETCFAGDMFKACSFVSRAFKAGVNLPCGDKLPRKLN
jgi:hypothetical protein